MRSNRAVDLHADPLLLTDKRTFERQNYFRIAEQNCKNKGDAHNPVYSELYTHRIYLSITTKQPHTMTPSTPTPTFRDIAHAAVGSCNSFAATLKLDPSKTARILAALSKDTPPEVTNATLSDSGTVLQFLYIGINDKTNVITRHFFEFE